MHKRFSTAALSAVLLSAPMLLPVGCGAPPDPKKQIVGKWRNTSSSVARGAITEFLPDGRGSTSITLNGKLVSDTFTYRFIGDDRIELISTEVSKEIAPTARATASFEVQFNGNTMTLISGLKSAGSGDNRKSITHERVE